MTQIEWINFKKLCFNYAVTGLCIFRVQIHLMKILYLDLCSAVLDIVLCFLSVMEV